MANQRAYWMERVRRNGYALEHVPEELQDRELVVEAVREVGFALSWAPEELQRDREVVLEAVRQDGLALRYAADELRDDREVVLAAVDEDGVALEFASRRLRADHEVALNAVRRHGCALVYHELYGRIIDDREIIQEAMWSGFQCFLVRVWTLGGTSDVLPASHELLVEHLVTEFAARFGVRAPCRCRLILGDILLPRREGETMGDLFDALCCGINDAMIHFVAA